MPEEIIIPEIPISIKFTFFGSDKSTYNIEFGKSPQGFLVLIQKNYINIHIQNINWIVPPDYVAAKELLELYLKNGKI